MENKKYYSVQIRKFPINKVDYTKPFADMDSNNTFQVYAEGNENTLVEILSGKQIQFGVLLEGVLPGFSKREIKVSEVSMYLKFLTEQGKRKDLEKINQCLIAVSEEIKNQESCFQVASEGFKEEINKGRK